MAGAALHGRLTWLAAEVVAIVEETRHVHSVELRVPGWQGHLPGQHVDVRLTAEDGYQAQRSYSIATPEQGESLTITVELVEDGEVSPYLVEDLKVGDRFELRGPIGGYFVWEPALGGPLQLIAGGSGVVPLMCMTRALAIASSAVASSAIANSAIPARLLLSARSWEEVIYRDELKLVAEQVSSLEVHYTLTRSQPQGWTSYSRRVDADLLAEAVWPAGNKPLIYVCGPTGFVETVASGMIELGHHPENVKTERFGPTGG
jgi:ferredoxin-NADP reductase